MSNRGTAVVGVSHQASSPSTNNRPSEQQIAARAHELFLKRGCAHGHDVEDWLQAEQELTENRKELALSQTSGRR